MPFLHYLSLNFSSLSDSELTKKGGGIVGSPKLLLHPSEQLKRVDDSSLYSGSRELTERTNARIRCLTADNQESICTRGGSGMWYISSIASESVQFSW